MTFAQAAAFALVLGMVGLFVWDRIRYDLVALMALGCAIVLGLVPPDKAFSGFADDIVIIVASALVVSAAVARSGAVERMMRPVTPHLRTATQQILVLSSLVTALSALVKNIGALTIFLPVAFQVARRSGISPSRLLMPLSFGSLLGGVVTLVGTSPNIIVSRMREELVGAPFRMFDFAPVGIGIALAGVAMLSIAWRLLPDRRGAAPEGPVIEDYATEVRLPAGSPFVGRTVYDLETAGEGDVTVAAIIREKVRRYVPSGHWTLFADDLLVLESNTGALERIVNRAGLEFVAPGRRAAAEGAPRELGIVEAVVGQGAPIIGQSAEALRLRDRYGINLLALSRRGRPVTQRLRRVRFKAGDLVVFQGGGDTMTDDLMALGCMPLAERSLRLSRGWRTFLPIGILVAAMALVTAGVFGVATAFFLAAVAVLLTGQLSLREAYEAVEWPLLVLLGALIPVSDALRTTGGTELIAGWLSMAAGALPPLGALALVLLAAMAVTPFLNNAATVLVMAPIGAGLARNLGLDPDPFLMAVALGAACDFLTPIGHQCNTLVMGPGGYRFGDYWRLGLPLSVMVVVLGTGLISVFWPLAAG
ncbi:SLC13 family permease [Arenibaculum pallidiluteum]|uniref:SLC13 family permease n=1 Tax=Arenibaculum pallidiluteum TaxID=2812559 RepID=UPI001A961DA8|nr:SLC13 family permease [Arenibaculum pallidiluteum]